MKGQAVAVLMAVLCASCHSPVVDPTPDTSRTAGAQPAVAGYYRFSTADLRIDFDIRADGTYHASMDAWAHVTEENGSWRSEGKSILLERRSGGLQMQIRRLGTLRQSPPGTLQILEPDNDIHRAIVFSKN